MENKIKGNPIDIIKYIKERSKTMSFISISLTICVMTTILIILWIQSKLTLKSKNCSKLYKTYINSPFISDINVSNSDYKHDLRDYYIKTAFNCCATGSVKNDFVDICALETCIKQGVRCLDFEIYSMNDNPVIAVSSENKYYIKESYNKIDFSVALTAISKAFSGSYAPNPNDPMILHFRIMTNNLKILDKMAHGLNEKLGRNILGKKYSYEYNKQNMGKVPLKDLLNKVVIIVDKSHANPIKTKLDEYVNLTSNSMFMRNIPFHNVKYSHDLQELINYNKKNMTMCYPDLKINMKNPSPQLIKAAGCQFIAMTFQNINDNLIYYNKMFNDQGSAFILKPQHLRHIPVLIAKPPPPKKELSYETRVIKEDYFQLEM